MGETARSAQSTLKERVLGALWRRLAPWMLGTRNRHLLVWDLLTQPLVAVMAFLLRFERLPSEFTDAIVVCVALSLFKVAVFRLLGMYNRFWRYANAGDVRLIITVGVASSAIQSSFVYLILVPLGVVDLLPRSIPILDALLTTAVVALPRLTLRLASRRLAGTNKVSPLVQTRVLVVGAGEAGHQVIDELDRNPEIGLRPVGLVDDDASKHGLKVGGCPVLGMCSEIPSLVKRHHIDRVIIAIPSADGGTVRRLAELGRRASVETMILPGMSELLSGSVSVERLRAIRVEDLLGRKQVTIDRALVASLLSGRRVLVTGGGGSIGSELCRQIASCRPSELIVLGRGENSLYDMGCELQGTYPELRHHLALADVRDRDRLNGVFGRFRPEIVYHAAAHKHVPLVEQNMEDGITNNVLGTCTLLDIALAHDVPRLVMVSTDKAVNPTSVMGATKRVAELLVQDAAVRSDQAYVAVRFGNVLGSRGSVVPLFERQIASGGPVTVTHPDMRRYFMTIPEAVELVLQAGALGLGGEVFVLDMGEPIRIEDLARDMIELSGLEPGRDIKLEYTGLRPGEKLFEELFLDGEEYSRSDHEKIYVCRNGGPCDEETSRCLRHSVEALCEAARFGDRASVHILLHTLVPEYPTGHRDEQEVSS